MDRSDTAACTFCGTGQLAAGRVTLETRWGEEPVLVKDAPADFCRQCGRYTLAREVLLRIQDLLVDQIQRVRTAGRVEIPYR